MGVETPGACTIVCTASAFTFKLDAVPADVTNLKLVIEATEGQSNGVLGAGAPKVFFRYYFVNSATGEKSGIVLASVSWTSSE